MVLTFQPFYTMYPGLSNSRLSNMTQTSFFLGTSSRSSCGILMTQQSFSEHLVGICALTLSLGLSPDTLQTKFISVGMYKIIYISFFYYVIFFSFS